MRCARPARRLSSPASWSSSASISRRSFSSSSDIGGKIAHRQHAFQLAQLVQHRGGNRAVRIHQRVRHLSLGLVQRSEEHTSELQSLAYLVCRLLLEKKKKKINM